MTISQILHQIVSGPFCNMCTVAFSSVTRCLWICSAGYNLHVVIQVQGSALMLQPALEVAGVVADEAAMHRSLDAAVRTLCQRLKQLQVQPSRVVVTNLL